MDELTQLRTQLTASLAPASRQWMRLLETTLADDEISAASVVPLIMIGRSGGGIHQVTLADQVGVVGPSMVRVLDRLCGDGLVRREEDRGDRRAKTLWLTATGQLLARKLEDRLRALRLEVFGQLTPEELRGALKVQSLLADAVERRVPPLGRATRGRR